MGISCRLYLSSLTRTWRISISFVLLTSSVRLLISDTLCNSKRVQKKEEQLRVVELDLHQSDVDSFQVWIHLLSKRERVSAEMKGKGGGGQT